MRALLGTKTNKSFIVAACFLLAGCPHEPAEPAGVSDKPENAVSSAQTPSADPTPVVLLEPVPFDALPGWHEDRTAEVLPAIMKSCARLVAQPADRGVGPDQVAGQVMDWLKPCEALVSLPGDDDTLVRRTIEAWFQPFSVADNGRREGMFTGYYETELDGDVVPQSPDAVPLYRRPPDLVSVNLGQFRADLKGSHIVGRLEGAELVPYHDRATIDGGALGDQNLELFWINDPVDAFFLHIQGSGRVQLPDGRRVRVGYAGSNGLTFYAIGAHMLKEGLIPRDQASAQSIHRWLRDNPGQAEAIMHKNPRYIFFREIEGEGPIGSQGVALTPGRSLAVDPDFMPLGAPIYLDTTWPASDRPLQRLMVTQDTGSAIKGPVRGDFFWGTGDDALAEAGRMKQEGRYFLFLPKSVAERRQLGS
ncbi:MAG: MltA domain-containing protein [Pseudomonadota bacterium]